MAHSEPTKAFPKQSPETAMLSAPFRCTHPPPPIPPFLLKQNLSPKVIAGSDVTRRKFHVDIICLDPGKGSVLYHERGVTSLLCPSTIGYIPSVRGCVYACEMLVKN